MFGRRRAAGKIDAVGAKTSVRTRANVIQSQCCSARRCHGFDLTGRRHERHTALRAEARRPSDAELVEMFTPFHQTRDAATRNALISVHQHLPKYFARRFHDRGEPIEDLIQVAQIGLISAIDCYDPTRGVRFGTYAAATIIGELKRYFRDKVWAIHIPRRHRELNYRLMQARGASTNARPIPKYRRTSRVPPKWLYNVRPWRGSIRRWPSN